MSHGKRFPAVTLVLIAANLVMAFALYLAPDLALDYGFRSDKPTAYTLLTSLFLHANVLHLLGNMVFLAAVGVAVELAAGSIRFATVYFVSGIAGVITHYALTHSSFSNVPYIGASGCIAGCVGYYSVRYMGLKVAMAPKTAVNVLVVTAVWVVLQVVGAFVKLGDIGGTAFWAHIGGFVAGVVLSLVYKTPDIAHLKMGHEVLARMNERGPAAVVHAAKQHLETHPKDPKAWQDLARAYALTDDTDGEANAILQLLDLMPEAEHPTLLARLIEIGQSSRLTPHKRTALAEKYKSSNPDISRILLKSVIEGSANDAHRPEAMLALAGLERDQHPARAQVLLDELMQAYPLHPCVELARKRGWLT